ncbi:MAG: hypothetical protein KDB88_04110 [Flavobacteriales bacterium]|nr:hypothetical protein [Flavobacteriales bacterium]
MKHLLFALLFSAPCLALAQNDTTTTERGHSLELGVSAADGAFAKVNAKDGPDRMVPDTFRVTTKRRLYTVLTEWRIQGSSEDSLERRMKQLRTERRNLFTNWAGVEFGFNNWITPSGSFDLPEEDRYMEATPLGSRFFAINVMEQKIEFGSHHAGLFTGLGMEFLNYRLSNNALLQFDGDSLYGVPMETPDLRKNKLRQIGIRVPLMFEFNTKRAPMPDPATLAGKKMSDPFSRKNNFSFAFGVVGSWYFENMYKVKYRQDGEARKDRTKGSFNLNPLRVYGRVQLGYGSFNLFAEYSLTELVQAGKGPELVPVNIGITLLAFN